MKLGMKVNLLTLRLTAEASYIWVRRFMMEHGRRTSLKSQLSLQMLVLFWISTFQETTNFSDNTLNQFEIDKHFRNTNKIEINRHITIIFKPFNVEY